MKTRKEQIEYLDNLKDEDIDYSDTPEVTDFTNWTPNPYYRVIKKQFSARIDADIIAWLKTGTNISKYVNSVLREKMMKETGISSHN